MVLREISNPWTVAMADEQDFVHINSSLLGVGKLFPCVLGYYSTKRRRLQLVGEAFCLPRDGKPVPYIPVCSHRIGRGHSQMTPGRFGNRPYDPVGKSYASKVDDEKMAFESGTNTRQYGHKKSATYIIAVFTDMDGQRGFMRYS